MGDIEHAYEEISWNNDDSLIVCSRRWLGVAIIVAFCVVILFNIVVVSFRAAYQRKPGEWASIVSLALAKTGPKSIPGLKDCRSLHAVAAEEHEQK